MEMIGEDDDANKERKVSLKSSSRPSSPSTQEARYFVESLKDWYDRPRAVSYATVPEQNVRRRGSWHPGIVLADLKGKATEGAVQQPELSATPAGEMKDSLLSVNKEELVDLVLKYYNELVGLGRTKEANRLLESVTHIPFKFTQQLSSGSLGGR
jgi:hypothetical protein